MLINALSNFNSIASKNRNLQAKPKHSNTHSMHSYPAFGQGLQRDLPDLLSLDTQVKQSIKDNLPGIEDEITRQIRGGLKEDFSRNVREGVKDYNTSIVFRHLEEAFREAGNAEDADIFQNHAAKITTFN